jgi:hypothetical protein
MCHVRYPGTSISEFSSVAHNSAGGDHTFQLTKHDYMLSGDTPSNSEQRDFVQQCLYSPESALKEVREFYESTTAKLFRQHSRKVGESYQVDIVRQYVQVAKIL